MSTCCEDCRARSRTSYESVHYHAQLARHHADNAVRYARRATRLAYVAGALIALSVVLQIVAAVAR